MRGATIAEVGDSLDGDLLGDDPAAAALRGADEALPPWSPRRCPAAATVHLSYGEEQLGEYVRQLAADHLVHALGPRRRDRRRPALDPDLVDEVAAGSPTARSSTAAAGAVGPRVDRPAATRRRTCWRLRDGTPRGHRRTR